MTRYSTLALFLVTIAACTNSSAEETDEGAGAATEADALTLESVLPEIAAAGISGAVKKLRDPRFDNLSEKQNRYYLEVRFGKLSEDQFKRIKGLFANQTKVPYDAGRSYELTDFLHPAMQAVVNQTFTTTSYSGMKLWEDERSASLAGDPTFEDLAKNGVSIESNCYNTTTEILRLLHPSRGSNDTQYNLYIPDREHANDWFSLDDYSDKVAPSDVKAGDVLVVKQRQEALGNTPYLAHTAIVLSKELVFEKTNGSSDDPYRVSLRKDVLALYTEMFKDALVVEHRRFNGSGKKAIPTPSVPTRELDAKYTDILKTAHPAMKPENVTMSKDFGFGFGGWSTVAQEIQPTRVIINPRTGRGILEADRATLSRFVGLAGR